MSSGLKEKARKLYKIGIVDEQTIFFFDGFDRDDSYGFPVFLPMFNTVDMDNYVFERKTAAEGYALYLTGNYGIEREIKVFEIEAEYKIKWED